MIGDFTINDDVELDDVVDFIETIEDNGYIVTKKWSEGKLTVKKRENQTLEESTGE